MLLPRAPRAYINFVGVFSKPMATTLSIRSARPKAAPPAGGSEVLAQQAASAPYYQIQLSRREWWLWFSAVLVTTLCSVAFALTTFRSFFLHADHFYEIRSDQARWATLCLLLLFNGWLIYRQWVFRRMRRQAGEQASDGSSALQRTSDGASLDPVTGLHTRVSLEQLLAKEVARARRQNTTLSLATLHVDDIADVTARLGKSAVDASMKELARYLKKASRGSDIAARLSEDDFLLVLPECGVTEVKQVLNRIPGVEVTAMGRRMPLTYTTGWVDYQAGDQPADLLKRAADLLHLYDTAAKDSFSISPR